MFTFDFYDMDFCRQAEALDISMGTWPISLIHRSIGKLNSDRWNAAKELYFSKYSD